MNTKLAEQIQAYIDKYRYEIVSRTCELVRIPSVKVSDDSGKPYGKECARALDFCDALCREKGLVTKNYDYRCLEAMCSERQSGKRLLIATHADVVPASEGNLYDPFAGTVRGDYILGRGTVDDKGPLVATLYALAFFKEYGIPLKNDVRLVFGSNEEFGMDDMQYYLETAGQPDWGISADGDFPTDNGEKSKVTFTVTAAKAKNVEFVRSRSDGQSLIHAYCESTIDNVNVTIGKTRPVTGGEGEKPGIENPVAHTILSSAVPIFQNAEEEACIKALLADRHGEQMGIACEHELFGKSVFRVCKAETEGENIVLTFDVRLPALVDLQGVADKIRRYGEEHRISVAVEKLGPGYYQAPDQEIVAMLTGIYNREMNLDQKPGVLLGGCTYTRLFRNGCGFGGGFRDEKKPFPPGHGYCHGADEAHNIGVLLNAVKMFILGIKAIDDMWS